MEVRQPYYWIKIERVSGLWGKGLLRNGTKKEEGNKSVSEMRRNRGWSGRE